MNSSVEGEILVLPHEPIIMPAATTAIMPLTWKTCSAIMNEKYARIVESVISISASDSIAPNICPTASANIQPTNAPPIKTTKNSPIPDITTPPENSPAPAVMIPMSNVASTKDVASLNRLSPSTNTVSRSGTPSCLKIEITATGSVALKIAPRSSNTNKSNSVKIDIMKPIIAVETNKPGTASARIGRIFLPTWRAFRLKADSKMSVGIKTNKTRSGVSAKFFKDPKPSIFSEA